MREGAPATPGHRREYVVVLVVLAAAAGALLAASGQDAAGGLPGTGRGPVAGPDDATPRLSAVGTAVGWAGLAAVAALLATRGRVRRAVGAAVTLLGVVAAVDLGGVLAGVGSLTPALTWPVIGMAGAAGLLVIGAVTLVRGSRWPVMGSRYDRHGATRTNPDDDPAALWNALSRGVDPTDERPTP